MADRRIMRSLSKALGINEPNISDPQEPRLGRMASTNNNTPTEAAPEGNVPHVEQNSEPQNSEVRQEGQPNIVPGTAMSGMVFGSELMTKFVKQVMDRVIGHLPRIEPRVPESRRPEEKEWADQLKDFHRLQPSRFDGKPDPIEADKWFQEIKEHLEVLGVTGPRKVAIAAHQFIGEAYHWWKIIKESPTVDANNMGWEEFEGLFYDKFFPKAVRKQKEAEFLRLIQRNMTVAQYEAEFTKLSRFVPDLVATEKMKASRFQDGLRLDIRDRIAPLDLEEYHPLIDRSMLIEREINEQAAIKSKGKNKRPQGHDFGNGSYVKKPNYNNNQNNTRRQNNYGTQRQWDPQRQQQMN